MANESLVTTVLYISITSSPHSNLSELCRISTSLPLRDGGPHHLLTLPQGNKIFNFSPVGQFCLPLVAHLDSYLKQWPTTFDVTNYSFDHLAKQLPNEDFQNAFGEERHWRWLGDVAESTCGLDITGLQFGSVQDGIHALGKIDTHSTSILLSEVSPNGL